MEKTAQLNQNCINGSWNNFKEESKCVSLQTLLQCSLDTELSWRKVKREIFSYPRVYSGGHILWDVTRHDHSAKTWRVFTRDFPYNICRLSRHSFHKYYELLVRYRPGLPHSYFPQDCFKSMVGNLGRIRLKFSIVHEWLEDSKETHSVSYLPSIAGWE